MQIIVYEILSRTEIRLILANRAVLQASGFSASQLVGKRVTEFFPADEAARAIQTVQMCVDTGTVSETIDQVTVPHGQLWVQCTNIPLPDSQGRITRVAIVMQISLPRSNASRKSTSARQRLLSSSRRR